MLVEIREAQPSDLPALASILAEHEGREPRDEAERFGRDDLTLVAVVGGAIAGFGRIARLDDDPPGWYLAGVVVCPAFRRLGIARELTRRRLDWIAERATEAYYFTNVRNTASIALHAGFGFVEIARLASGTFRGTDFEGGEGALHHTKLG